MGICRSEILNGEVKDYYRPMIAGVGYIGKLIQRQYKYEYSLWKHMLHRCYNVNDNHYKFYGAKGVIVDEKWHNFENFINDLPLIEGYDEKLFKEKKLQLDKDLKSNVNKIYSLETCKFMTCEENLHIMRKQNNKYKKEIV